MEGIMRKNTSFRMNDYGLQQPIQTSRLIEIIPPDSVRFQYFEDGLIIGNFTISNKTKSIKVFRILTSSFQNYIVLPSSGILLSRDTLNSQMKINIMMKKQKNIEKRLKDKFLIEALETLMNMNDLKEEDLRNINVADIWRERNNCSVKYQKTIIPISLIYSDKSSESFWSSNTFLKNVFSDNLPQNNEFSNKNKTNEFVYDKNYESDGDIIKKTKQLKLNRTQLSMTANSAFIENRRNASVYTERIVQENHFEENYKQKYERLNKIADEQYNKIESLYKERDDFLNEINKLKFVYENKVSKTKNYEFQNNLSTVKIWQMLLICVVFLIIGSFISFIGKDN